MGGYVVWWNNVTRRWFKHVSTLREAIDLFDKKKKAGFTVFYRAENNCNINEGARHNA